jgi:thiamine biosynthesis lipoprotein
MPFAERLAVVCLAASALRGDGLLFVHGQRYAMGTMFDIAVYHPAGPQGEHAIEIALAEITRLDKVLSHYDPDSDLSRLLRARRGEFVAVAPALYDVLSESLEFSRRSGGSFDVTIGPLVRAWQSAQAAGHAASAEAVAAAKRCVGYENVQLRRPDLVRLESACLAIDLGGIGKGYAVDRAMRILQESGIRHAVINAGQSTIAAIGHPPDHEGWPVAVGANDAARDEIELRNSSLSTSRQARVPLGGGERGYAGIIDPARGRPVESSMTVVVRSASATESDALSTTLLLLSPDEGKRVLESFPRASALWISADGTIAASHHEARPVKP